MTALAFDHYDWAGGREPMLRFGPTSGPTVVVAPALLEEGNRTRALVVATLRLLADRGIGGVLPDLPGQGESLRDLTDIRAVSWRRAFAAAVVRAGGTARIVALRGGTLIDGDAAAAGRLHLSPVSGRLLVRDLFRARRAARLAEGARPIADNLSSEGPPILLAGNRLDRALLRDLAAAEPSVADRVVRLFPDTAPADAVLAPPPRPAAGSDQPRFRAPWFAAEPLADPALAAALADAIARWIGACAA